MTLSSGTVVVTGGAGFIGSHLVDQLLENNYKVRIIDDLSAGRLINLESHKNNSNIDFFEENILNINVNSKIFNNVDTIFHLAGIGDIVPSIENPAEYFNVNVQGTINILEAARQNKVKKVLYAASSSCYGFAQTPTDENHPTDPRYPYALSKLIGEQAVFHWGQVYGMNTSSICIFNAFGPRVKTKGAYGAVFGVFLKQKLEKKSLTIVGDGSQSRDFVHVRDVARAFFLASKFKHSLHRFNIGSGKPITILELAKLIGGDITNIPKRPGEPESTHANIAKAKQLLGWQPEISFEDGVNEMLTKIEDWKDAPLWDEKTIAESTSSWFKFLGGEHV